MTEAAAFAKGDQVTGPKGKKYVVVNQGSPGGAVLVETPKGVKPYDSTFLAADSLKKGSSRSKPKEEKPADETYVITYTDADGEEKTLSGPAASADDAEQQFAELKNEGETFVSVAKAVASVAKAVA